MRKAILTSLMICAAVLMSVELQAQAPATPATPTPAAPPAAGGTADGMPFDIPYGAPISLESAKKLIAAVEAEATNIAGS